MKRRALKARLALNDRATEQEVIRKYQLLKKAPKSIYSKAVKLPIPAVDGQRPLHDFLGALNNIDQQFTSSYEVTLGKRARKGKDPPTLYDLVEDYTQITASAAKNSLHSAFTTFQSESANSSFAPKSESKKPRDLCMCGVKHRFEDCPYLIPTKRPKGWTADPEIQTTIDEKVKNHPKLRGAVLGAQ